MRQRLVKLCCAMLLGVVGTASVAQEAWIKGLPDEVEIDLRPKQLFFLFTSGDPKPIFNDNGKVIRQKKIKEYGTGFAIAEKVIITAKHVTRSASEFLNQSSDEKIVIPKRDVAFSFPVDSTPNAFIGEPNKDVWVTPSPVVTTDAARLDLDTETVDPFELSVCPIEQGRDYFLLKFRQTGKVETENSNAKNLRVPVVVPLKADVDVTARLGNLRRFELKTALNDDNLDRPIGGDSGSPILDSKGRVVGLLTALQGSSYLWVTPTASFLDLVPTEIQETVACPDNVPVTYRTLTVENTRRDTQHTKIKEEIARVETETATAFRGVDGRHDDLKSLVATLTTRIDTLEGDIADLRKKDGELDNEDVKLSKRDDDLDLFIKETDLRSTTVLTAMLLKAEQRGAIPPGKLNDVLNEMLNEKREGQDTDVAFEVESLQADLGRLFEQDPVLPAIAQMTEDLGVPSWGFGVVPNAFGLGRPQFNIGYQRNISLPLISKEMAFCVRPLYEFRAGIDSTEHSHLNYRSDAFYTKADKILGRRQFQASCEWSKQRPGIEIAKAADYGFPLDIAPRFRANEQPQLKMDERPTFFYGWAYDEGSVNYETDTVQILHRFVLEVEEVDGLPQVSCYYLAEQTAGQIADAVAEIVDSTGTEIKEARKCPEL